MRRVACAVLLAFVGIIECSDDDVYLRFYKRTFDHYIEVPLQSGHTIVSSDWYEAGKPTVFFTHGFTGKPLGPAVTAVVSAFLDNGNNVVLLNWEKLANVRLPGIASSYLNWASPNAKKLGAEFAKALSSMLTAGLRLNSTRLVGHSLGAQLFGIAGAKLGANGVKLPWITGLDPASVGYESSSDNLNSGCAAFVDIIHSDPNKYGYRKPHGTVDYWPNYSVKGPVRQPGCSGAPSAMFTPDDLCSHNRSWQLLVDSLRHPRSLLASYAKHYRAWKSSDLATRRQDVLAIGERPPTIISGDYFLTTNDRAPYGRGLDGI